MKLAQDNLDLIQDINKGDFDFDKRLQFYDLVIKFLNKIVDNRDETVCINKGGNLNLLDFFKNKKNIGSNSRYGEVYMLKMDVKNKVELKVAIKLIPLSYRDRIQMYDTKLLPWPELKALKLINDVVKKRICHNLPLYFTHYLCNYCMYARSTVIGDKTKNCMLILNELADYDLRNWVAEMSTLDLDEVEMTKLWYNIFFQIFIGIYVLQKYCDLVHRDLHWGNVLITKVKKGGYWKYILNGVDYYLPNMGYIAKLWDFGQSMSMTHFQRTKDDWETIQEINQNESSLNSYYSSDVERIIEIDRWIENTNTITNKKVMTENFRNMLRHIRKDTNKDIHYIIENYMSEYLNDNIGKNCMSEKKAKMKDLSVGKMVCFDGKFALILKIELFDIYLAINKGVIGDIIKTDVSNIYMVEDVKVKKEILETFRLI
jgi:hypothetical protein